jgi:hypothetical protein
MSDTFITANEQVHEAAELIGKAREIFDKMENPVDSSFYRVLAALNTALAECSDYHLKLELAIRRDWKDMEEGK